MRFEQSKCKFCGEPITLSLPDDTTSPVWALTCMGACNRCADQRGGPPVTAPEPERKAPVQSSLPYKDTNEDDSRTL